MSQGSVWGSQSAIASAGDVFRLEQKSLDQLIGVSGIYDLLARSAATRGAAPAMVLVQNGETLGRVELTYDEMFSRVTQAANAFIDLGVGPDDAVSILLPGTPDGHIALWAAASVGRACPINYFLAPNRIAELILAAQSRVLVVQGPSGDLPIWNKLDEILTLASLVETMIVVDGPSDPSRGRYSFFDLCALQPSGRLKSKAPRRLDDIVALFHTGGTTGAPKLAKHSARNQLFTASIAGLMYGAAPSDRVLNGLPIYHVAGSLIWGLTFLAAGSCLVLPTATGWRNRSMVANVWDLIDREGITIAAAVPTSIAAMASAFPVGARKNSLRMVVTGGAPLARALAEDFETRFGAQICELYGMTETAGVAAITPALQPRRPGAAGMRLPYGSIEIHNPHTGERCAPNDSGVIHIRGPNIFPGYVDSPQNVGTLSEDGLLCSGDLGYLDGCGWLHVTGRKKDLIIRGGHNIEPGTIEDAFFSHPDVSLCAAVGQIDPYAGEVPVAYVVLKPASGASVDDLLAHVTALVGEPFARPRKIYIVDALPTTAVGKVIKRDLRLDAAQRVLGDLVRAIPQGGRLKVAVRYAAHEAMTAEIGMPAGLSDAQKRSVALALADVFRPFAIEFSLNSGPKDEG